MSNTEAGPPTKIFDVLSAGPYPVGVTTVVLVDESRSDSVTGGPRTLVTEVWYPATEEARAMPKNSYLDFIPGGLTEEVERLSLMPGQVHCKVSMLELERRFWNEAVRDAPVREGRFPVVIFSHATNGSRFQNTFWCDHLASHGYIILAPDHTGNARMTVVNGRVILYRADKLRESIFDRPKDIMFLIDRVALWDAGGDGRFAGRLDPGAVCAAGHSFGSASAIAVATVEPRLKAVIGMAQAYRSYPPNPNVPTLHMLGAEDRFAGVGAEGNEVIRQHHAQHTGPSFLLELKNGGHLSFTDNLKLSPEPHESVGPGLRHGTNEPFVHTPRETAYQIINSYSAAFLGVYLKGQEEYIPFLLENHWPEEVTWAASLPGRDPAGV